MPSKVRLKIQARNAETLRLQVTTQEGTPVPLTGESLEFVVKKYSSDPDPLAVLRGSLITGTTTIDPVASCSPLRIVDEALGIVELDLLITRHGHYAWRLDLVSAGGANTALYGLLEVEPT